MLCKYFIVFLALFTNSIASYRVNQKAALKQGFCPREFLRQKVCDLTCDSDNDCPGVFKCCITDCGGRACVKPSDGSKSKAALEPVAKNILVETKPLEQQQQQLVSVNNPQCPPEVAAMGGVSCSASCQLNKDCLSNQICCEAKGCSTKVCVNNLANQAPVRAKSFRTSTKEPNYDDYYEDNSYYSAESQKKAKQYDDYNYGSYGGHLNKKKLTSVAEGFQGPLVNTQNGLVMAYQRNPLHKLEKRKFVQYQLPRFSVQQQMHQMQPRFSYY
jgi:hypothetical protein